MTDIIARSCPAVLAFGGLAGVGKTTIARLLACRVGPQVPAEWLSTDAVRKELAGVPWSTRLPDSFNSREARDAIYQEIRIRAERVLSEGRSCIWDASFSRLQQRRMVEHLASRLGYAFVGLIFVAPIETRCIRAGNRSANPSDADEQYIRNREKFEGLTTEELQWKVIDTSGSIGSTLNLVIGCISS